MGRYAKGNHVERGDDLKEIDCEPAGARL